MAAITQGAVVVDLAGWTTRTGPKRVYAHQQVKVADMTEAIAGATAAATA